MPNSEVAGGDSITVAKLNEITVGTTAPTAPTEGDLWVDTSTSGRPVMKAYDGTVWTVVDLQNVLGDGSDGVVTISGSTTLTRPMFYSTLTVANGGTLQTDGWPIFCTGTVTVQSGGIIHNDGADAVTVTGGAGGAGGYGLGQHTRGGQGGDAGSSVARGARLGGGSGGEGGQHDGGWNGIIDVTVANLNAALLGWPVGGTGVQAGTPDAYTIAGGGGGGSNYLQAGPYGAAGGGGGGVVDIIAATITVDAGGIIRANAGNGSAATGNNYDGGGGGGGGVVILRYRLTYTNNGTVQAAAGSGGAGNGTGSAGDAGSAGAVLSVQI